MTLTTELPRATLCLSMETCPMKGLAMQSKFDISNYGAIAGGNTKCTQNIQNAIDECADAGGGTVLVPAGTYLTGPLMLKTNVALHIDSGAVLLASSDMNDFVTDDTRYRSTENQRCLSLITAYEQSNIAVTGHGVLDGGGEVWWEAKRHDSRLRKGQALPEDDLEPVIKYGRPHIIGFYWCNDVLIRDIKMVNSPQWTVHPMYCQNVVVDGVTIINPERAPNADGVNPESCKNVRISNCLIDTGDDCVTIKSGQDEEGRRIGIPCENICVTNCNMIHGHGGVTIGSEMSGGVSNVVVSNCVFDRTDVGLRIKTARGRGGVVENIRASNIVMRDVRQGLQINMFYATRERPQGGFEVDEGTPRFRNIHYSDIIMSGVTKAAMIRGIEEMPMEDLTFNNISGNCDTGIECDTARRIAFRDITMDTQEGPSLACANAEDIEIDSFRCNHPHANAPVISLENVNGAFIHNCTAARGTGVFTEIRGEQSTDIVHAGNNTQHAQKPFSPKEGVQQNSLNTTGD